MKKIGIFSRVFKDRELELLKTIFEVFKKHHIQPVIYDQYFKQIEDKLDLSGVEVFSKFEVLDAELLITIGGDGTLLNAITLTDQGRVPVFGINTGRLGFLTSVHRDEVELAFEALFDKDYLIEKRTMLMLRSKENLFGKWNFALNECTVMKSESTSMITVHAYIDGDFLNSYWGDGLIFSTPTGSTGYSLSCGGPILEPGANSFVITPIAPHNLSIRPLVISDGKVINFKVEGRSEHFLSTLDARAVPTHFSAELTLHKAPFRLKMLRLKDYSFLSTIRNKLMWGADRRNIK